MSRYWGPYESYGFLRTYHTPEWPREEGRARLAPIRVVNAKGAFRGHLRAQVNDGNRESRAASPCTPAVAAPVPASPPEPALPANSSGAKVPAPQVRRRVRGGGVRSPILHSRPEEDLDRAPLAPLHGDTF